MPGKLLVDERVVGIEQLEHAAILLQRGGYEQFRFSFERRHQRQIVIRVALRIDDDLPHAAEIQPLRGEITDERLARSWIRKQPGYLLLEDLRVAQFAFLRQREQFVVRNAGPQKEGDTARKLDVGQPVGLRAGI